MHPLQRIRTFFLLGVLAFASTPTRLLARDGSHDFDFEVGTWRMHLSRRLHPLTGSTTWEKFDGTSVTRKIWNGRAFLEQFETDGKAGPIEGLTLRLYNPQSHQWSLYWATSEDGALGNPMIGEFKNGRGEFFDQEPFQGRAILVRYVWSRITPNSAHFEQSYSDDGGKTWEVNWITSQTRISPRSLKASRRRAAEADAGQHDFDFEFGNWNAHLKRLLHPLTGSNTWVEYDGNSVVHRVWDGRANLGELEVENRESHIEGLSLRLYNPRSRQWSIDWANSADGSLGRPMMGGFRNGQGEFFDQELFHGAAIFVRFIFSNITSTSFRLVQSFSADGGKTWEPNWIATFTRQKP